MDHREELDLSPWLFKLMIASGHKNTHLVRGAQESHWRGLGPVGGSDMFSMNVTGLCYTLFSPSAGDCCFDNTHLTALFCLHALRSKRRV